MSHAGYFRSNDHLVFEGDGEYPSFYSLTQASHGHAVVLAFQLQGRIWVRDYPLSNPLKKCIRKTN